jgi:hypothetical protein
MRLATSLVICTAMCLSSSLAHAQTQGELVTLTAADGARLATRYLDAGAGAPGMLFFHMCREEAVEGWRPIAERLHKAGVSSLLFTSRGFGGTSGTSQGDQRANDAEAAFAYLRTRVGADAPIGVAGSSCGVYSAMQIASRHAAGVRAAVALAGPHTAPHQEYVRTTPRLAVFSGSSTGETPAVEWANALKAASPHAASRVAIAAGSAHGTDIFPGDAAFAQDLAAWLIAQLKAR